MTTVLSRRAWREVTRHKLRAAFTVATLAAAVAGIWLFATPRQLEAAMRDLAAEDAIHDVRLYPNGLALDADDLQALRELPNIAALDVRSNFFTQMRVDNRIQDVVLVGVTDFEAQNVNIVAVDAGQAPRHGIATFEALTDPQNARSGRHTGGIGAQVELRSGSGSYEPATITGEASTLYFSEGIVEGSPVLYVPVETVWSLWPFPDVFATVDFRVADRSDAATARTIDAVQTKIAEIKPDVLYNDLAEIRPAGEWPGKEGFDTFLVLFWVIAGVSLISSLALVATTATTLVREQTREIGIMRALGGTRSRIMRTFGFTMGLLGAAGTLIGIAIGIPLSNALSGFLGREFIGVDPDWSLGGFALLASVAVGVGGTLVASLPALLRAVRIPVRESLQSTGIEASYGQSRLDRSLRDVRLISGPLRLGLRNVFRRKGRTAATTVQVALAIGTLLGFTSLVVTMVDISEQSRIAEGGDIEVFSTGADRLLDNAAVDLVTGIDGVGRVQPTAWAPMLVGDVDTFVWGLPAEPIYPYELSGGRWFTADEASDAAPVAVIGPALAKGQSLRIGQTILVQTRTGSLELEVIGVDTTMVGDGKALFAPLGTVLGANDQSEPTQMWVDTTSDKSADIDRVGAEINTTLEQGGYGASTDLRYVERDAERTQDRTVIAVIMGLGLPVVAIGMIGLASAIATSALERTREIGVLRSIGASARDIRKIFRAEAVAIITFGWLVGIGVGYVVARIILWAMSNAFEVDFDLLYPLWPLPVALALTVVVGAMVLARPLRHASRLSPNVSLRYQ